MGLTYPTYLEAKTIYGCRKCKTHLSTGEAVLSRLLSVRTYHVADVKAYNEDNNYKEGKRILEKKLLTDDVR
ncbi:hypothetical protein VTP01DRAFT_5147 [Rhizomucor pusillus]|uniref:uncharacterized protein n=1 Tax=Rhizomucor pusillus TaxID=4840 RepID=UPI00374461F7